MHDGFAFIQAWHARVQGAVTDALAFLAQSETNPVSDGILADWLRTLVSMRYRADELPLIAQLIDKADPHLQEAGVMLARTALRCVDGVATLAPALERLCGKPIDSWVLLALVDLLAEVGRGVPAVYVGLAAHHRQRPRGFGIQRNRFIDPWRALVELYEQHAIQELHPGDRDLAYLPILERELGTHGWEPTQRFILTRMGFAPDEYLARLRRR